jgi:hypothetical protein
MTVMVHHAQQILGFDNVHWPGQVYTHFRVIYTPEQLWALDTVLFSEATLQVCAGTHILFPGAPLSLLDIRERHPALFYSRKPAWLDREAEKEWAAAPVEPRWFLLRKEPVPWSRRKTYAEQVAVLPDGEVMASAGEVAYGVILHHLATGEYLLPDVWARCRDLGSDGERVVVGGFDRHGLFVSSFWDVSRYDYVGLAAVRKS